MQLGLIGLGKMGGNMAERLRRDGHEVVGYDRNPDSPRTVDSLEALAAALSAPRVVWVMVPSGEPTRQTIGELGAHLEAGDIIIDGGNSRYTDDQLHATALAEKGVRYIDAGVSGGVWGLTEGYALMVGGDAETVAVAQPIFDSLKPPGDGGFVHAGPVGAGHFTKMVHNGIEYGIMQAYGEGYELLKAVDLVAGPRRGVRVLVGGHGHPVLAARPADPGAARRPGAVPDPAATPRIPARAGGPSRPRSRTRCRCR